MRWLMSILNTLNNPAKRQRTGQKIRHRARRLVFPVCFIALCVGGAYAGWQLGNQINPDILDKIKPSTPPITVEITDVQHNLSGSRVHVYQSVWTCTQGEAYRTDAKSYCLQQHALAHRLADNVVWPYTSGSSCAQDYGIHCIQHRGRWQPRPLGFALFDETSTVTAAPVYYSLKHPGYYLANGYAVKLGQQAFPYLVGKEQLRVISPQPLRAQVCHPKRRKSACYARYELAQFPYNSKERRWMFQ